MNKTYAPCGYFLWDFWLFAEAGKYHLYHLQAPLKQDAHSRHSAASVGYAVSENLRDWQPRGTVLEASENPADWDSVSIWTGCTIKKDGRYYMFYTSRCRQEVLENGYMGHTQRIGVAWSEDLKLWHKYEYNPVLSVGGSEYYENQAEAYNRHEGCRDPFVILDETGGTYYMFFTARDKRGEPRSRGCIGRARSKDLLNWELLPPAASPHTFVDMEVPTLHRHQGKWYLLFAVKKDWYSPAHQQAILPAKPQTGELYLVADRLDGQFEPMATDNVISGTADGLYTGRIVKDTKEQDVFLAWGVGPDEGFAATEASYRLSLPRRVLYDEQGKMMLEK
ncbi:glycoside hydrolase family 68 protein [Propionispora hippei]|uniref:Beta-fructofuranosidase n=1 Tax=Propionispora hippei DSM 15287 TaxID=1123003 RepID=A0A1M6G7U3_9FIRM|nr:glycoside hydrolase family 68 protein [Propionispora hippei]SHJ05999.1 beta-fructofuranosidase [Propionispora hippei DSM 15287]